MDWWSLTEGRGLGELGCLAGLAVAFGVLTRLTPCNRGMYWWKDLGAFCTDLAYWFVGPLLSRLCSALSLAAVAAWALADREKPWAAALPLWQQCLAVLLLQDVLLYWAHRLFHTRPGWRFHAVHHSAEVLDWMSAWRFHPVNHLLAFCLADAIALLLGFPVAALVVLAPFNVLYSALVHSNLNWTFGPLRYVLASPVFHRWHHTAAEAGRDRNFASTFPFLDLLFGTYFMPPGRVPEQFGNGEADYPTAFWAQLLRPFARRAARASTPTRTKRGRLVGAATALTAAGLAALAVAHGVSLRQCDAHLGQGDRYFSGKEYGRAIEEYNQAIRCEPGCALAYANRAAALLQQGEPGRAVEDCDRAVGIAPRLAVAYANRGGAFLNQGDNERAVADCTRAVELDPTLALAYANRGGAFLKKRDAERALSDCDRALALDPGLVVAHLTRAGARLAQGDALGAVRECDRVVQLDPEMTTAYMLRGMVQVSLRHLEQARQDFSRAITLNPKLASAYVNRGAVGFSMGDLDRVMADCTHAVELDPRLALAYWYRALAHSRKREYDRARLDQEKALALDPSLEHP
jgi:sterol desaturase/sphingolipid hydroxylase (fatty acid hydroxylase superfamily)/Tfp pilus assembly protein PilF